MCSGRGPIAQRAKSFSLIFTHPWSEKTVSHASHWGHHRSVHHTWRPARCDVSASPLRARTQVPAPSDADSANSTCRAPPAQQPPAVFAQSFLPHRREFLGPP